jgi:D-alanyl-D-alanine carboxypeptidase
MLLAKTLLVAGALAVAALSSPPTAAGARSLREPTVDPTHAALERAVRNLVREGAPGALAVVRTRSGIRGAASGLARRRPRIAMAKTDRFQVGSITKTFIATVVLQLVAEGKLRLDDSVAHWLPGLVPHGAAITVRELLDHTSGLFDYVDDKPFVRALIAHPARFRRPRKLVAVATSHPPLFPPGQGWWYSNTNYILLGLIAEAASRTTIQRQLEQRLLRPLHLNGTSLPRKRGIEGPHADGYIGSATVPRLRRLFDATAVESPSVPWTAGGIVSTGKDVTRFYAALLGGRLLPARLLAAMKRPVPGSHYLGATEPSYGLGLAEVSTSCGPAYGHEGIATGYRTVAYARPDGSRVALVMINVDETRVPQGDLELAADTAFCAR